MMMRKIFFIACFLLSTVSFAATTTTSPEECTPIKVKTIGKNIILNTDLPKDSAQVYLLKNISKKSLWLDHPTKRVGVSAGWATYLRTGRWSALLVNRKEFSVSCAVIQPGHADYLNCGQQISVCASKQVTKGGRKGTYWVAEDKSWEEVMLAVNKLTKK